MRAFSQNAAGVIREMYEEQEPFLLTRHGKMLAVVTPLPEGIESELAGKYLSDHAKKTVKADQKARA